MKKLGLITLVLLMFAFLMASCQPNVQEVEESTTTQKKQYIVFVTPLLGNELFLDSKLGYEDAAKEMDFDTLWVGSDSVDMDVMVQHIETCIVEKVDGIISCPVNPSAFEPVYKKASDAGIPIVNMVVDSAEDTRLAYVGTDHKTFGEEAAKALGEKMNGSAKVAVMQGPMDAANTNAQIEAFINYCKTNYPDVEIVVREGCDDDLQIAIDKTNAILQAYPEINAFWSVNGVASTAISQVFEEKNITSDDIVFLACDEVSVVLDSIRNGYTWSTLAQNFYTMGYEPAKIIMDHINGKPTESIVDSGVTLISKDNIDTYKDNR